MGINFCLCLLLLVILLVGTLNGEYSTEVMMPMSGRGSGNPTQQTGPVPFEESDIRALELKTIFGVFDLQMTTGSCAIIDHTVHVASKDGKVRQIRFFNSQFIAEVVLEPTSTKKLLGTVVSSPNKEEVDVSIIYQNENVLIVYEIAQGTTQEDLRVLTRRGSPKMTVAEMVELMENEVPQVTRNKLSKLLLLSSFCAYIGLMPRFVDEEILDIDYNKLVGTWQPRFVTNNMRNNANFTYVLTSTGAIVTRTDLTLTGLNMTKHTETHIPKSRIILQEDETGVINELVYLFMDPHCQVKYWFCPLIKDEILFMGTHDYFPHTLAHYMIMVEASSPTAFNKIKPLVPELFVVTDAAKFQAKKQVIQQASVQPGLYLDETRSPKLLRPAGGNFLDIFDIVGTMNGKTCDFPSLDKQSIMLDFLKNQGRRFVTHASEPISPNECISWFNIIQGEETFYTFSNKTHSKEGVLSLVPGSGNRLKDTAGFNWWVLDLNYKTHYLVKLCPEIDGKSGPVWLVLSSDPKLDEALVIEGIVKALKESNGGNDVKLYKSQCMKKEVDLIAAKNVKKPSKPL